MAALELRNGNRLLRPGQTKKAMDYRAWHRYPVCFAESFDIIQLPVRDIT